MELEALVTRFIATGIERANIWGSSCYRKPSSGGLDAHSCHGEATAGPRTVVELRCGSLQEEWGARKMDQGDKGAPMRSVAENKLVESGPV